MISTAALQCAVDTAAMSLSTAVLRRIHLHLHLHLLLLLLQLLLLCKLVWVRCSCS
jgi:hypothetical protein